MVASRENIRTARSNSRLPHLALAADVDVANPNSRFVPASQTTHTTWDVGAILSWQPNTLLTGAADTRIAEADLAQSQADLDSLEDGLRTEVRQSYEDFLAAQQAFQSARVGVTAAEETYRVRMERFHVGAAVTTEIVDADADLNRARLDLLNAAVDQHIAQARLRRATGENVAE